MPSENELFIQLTGKILAASDCLHSGECLEEALPTAADLARQLNFRLENVKKKLKVLKEQGLIQPISVTPKRYRFNRWALKSVNEASPLYALFCEPDSPYYIDPKENERH